MGRASTPSGCDSGRSSASLITAQQAGQMSHHELLERRLRPGPVHGRRGHQRLGPRGGHGRGQDQHRARSAPGTVEVRSQRGEILTLLHQDPGSLAIIASADRDAARARAMPSPRSACWSWCAWTRRTSRRDVETIHDTPSLPAARQAAPRWSSSKSSWRWGWRLASKPRLVARHRLASRGAALRAGRRRDHRHRGDRHEAAEPAAQRHPRLRRRHDHGRWARGVDPGRAGAGARLACAGRGGRARARRGARRRSSR